jgi:hypothetical protein
MPQPSLAVGDVERTESSARYHGIRPHSDGIVRLFSKYFPWLDRLDAVISELHHCRFAVLAFRAFERALVVIGFGGRNNPGKKHRDPACGASTLRNRWSFGVERIRPVHDAPPFLLQAGARWRLSVTGAWAEPLPIMVHGALITARSLCHTTHRWEIKWGHHLHNAAPYVYARQCLLLLSLSGAKRTYLIAAHMSASDPKQT